MGLDDYNAKRRFTRTPEPFGARGTSDPDNLRFVIQHHFASREHFDLRLEIGGVLASWAVPEGPSLDPAHKRLAVRTEDHPLSYGDFEGIIPADEYGGGVMLIWDRGTWVPVPEDPAEALEAGELKFRLSGDRLGGGWMLKKLPKGDKEWLLIKERDTFVVKGFTLPEPEVPDFAPPEAAGVAAPLPKAASPQLPSAVDAPPEGAGWLHEIKYDGYRTLARVEGGGVRFITRQGLDWTTRYGVLAERVAALDCETAMIDGEVCVADARGATSLEMLQLALTEGRDHDLIFYAFDLLHLDGRDLTKVPLIDRKALLRRLVPADPLSRVQYSDHVTGGGKALFSQVVRIGLEGVVSKQAGTPYRQTRTQTWVKAKRFDVGQFEVIGFTTKSSARHIASLILAEDDGDGLRHVGRAGSGLSLDETRALHQTLSAIETETAPVPVPKTANAHFIPLGAYTAEISYRGRTKTGSIRHAAILDVRAVAETAPAEPRSRLITDRDLASIRLTNPDRLYEGTDTTKLDVALYYARVGEWMLPELLKRPVTMIRAPGPDLSKVYYQRHGFSGLPDGVETVGDTRDEEFLVIRDAKGFLGLPQFGVIEFHPWDCTVDDLDHPDRMTIDLDPGEGVDWPTVIAGAGTVRTLLAEAGLTGFVRTTGGAGLHVVVPLEPVATWDEVQTFLKALAATLTRETRLFIDTPTKSKRSGRIFADVGRTRFGASAAGSYSLRAKSGFGVALPLLWQDLHAGTPPSAYHRKNAANLIEKRPADPWADFDVNRGTITATARKRVGLR